MNAVSVQGAGAGACAASQRLEEGRELSRQPSIFFGAVRAANLRRRCGPALAGRWAA